MDTNGQLILALACVAWAALVIVLRAVRLCAGRGHSAGSCSSSGCTSCPASSGTASHGERGFVSADALMRKRT